MDLYLQDNNCNLMGKRSVCSTDLAIGLRDLPSKQMAVAYCRMQVDYSWLGDQVPTTVYLLSVSISSQLYTNDLGLLCIALIRFQFWR
jgi:hypothetical protein